MKTCANPFAQFLHAFMQRDPRASMMAREIAMVINPEPADDPKGRFWRDGEREYITCGLLALAEFTPEDCTPPGVCRLLSSVSMLDDALTASAQARGALGDLATRIISRRKSNPEHAEDFLNTARRRVEIYEEGGLLKDVGEGDDFDHASIKNGNMAVFIVGSQEGGDVLAPNTMLHLTAFLQATKTKPAAPVRFIVDEATNSPVQSLVEEFTKLRAYGGRIQFIAQAESEIRKKFGDKSAETVETQCGVKQIMGVSKHEDAERLSKALGMGPGVAETLNAADKDGRHTKGMADQGRLLMTASEIRELSRDEQIILVDGLPPIRAKKLAQNEIGPWGANLAANPLEGGALPYEPKIEITYGAGDTPNSVRQMKRVWRAKKAKHTRLLQPAYFLWVPVAASLAIAGIQIEEPHLRWSTSYREFLGRTDYSRCDYIGVTGSFTLPADFVWSELMDPMVLTLFLLPCERTNFASFECAQHAVRITVEADVLIPERLLKRVKEGGLLGLPKRLVGRDAPQVGAKLICVGESCHAQSLPNSNPATQIWRSVCLTTPVRSA